MPESPQHGNVDACSAEAAWAAVRAIGAVTDLHKEEIARRRRLPEPIEAAFVEHDVYRLLVPADLGGAGVDPLVQFDLVEALSAHDASVGWNYAVGSGLGIFSGFLPRGTVSAIFPREGGGIAGSGAPQGSATRVDGGYSVSGTFGWASGIDQARWVYGGCLVHGPDGLETDDEGRPVYILIFAPKDRAVVHDRWAVGGLAATNSTSFTLDRVFVPDAYSFRAPWDRALHPAALFRLPRSFFGFALTGVPLGVARRTVAGLRALGTAPARAGRVAPGESAFVQYAVAKAEALVEAGRLAARAAFEEMWQTVRSGAEGTMEQRARVRRNGVHAAESSLDAVNLCYRAAGGAALFSSAPFEAAVRDVSAMCGHLVFQRAMIEDAGRVAFGLPPLLPNF